ncbi:70-kilodalton heat shock protein [Aphanomyces cochlioides]|nr:70-kilodalton heat shock protein [Aphanomyces cochlioides]
MARDNLFLGQFKLEGIPTMARGSAQIDITYDVDANGILDVSAVETSSGSKKKITITRDHVLTTEEIERMAQDAERYKAEDEANMLRIEAKNDLEGRAYVIRDNVQRPDLIMSNQDKEDIESMVTEVLGWLDDNQLADRETFETKEVELYEYAISKGLPP